MSGQGKPVKAPSSYPALKGKLVKASSFTDGSIKTFFAPGQTEYSVLEYDNPTAWRPRGSLLKMPQVVWLSCHFPYSVLDISQIGEAPDHQTIRDPLEPDASWDPWWNVFWNAGSGYSRSWEYMGGSWFYPDYCEDFWFVFRYDNEGITGFGSPIYIDGVVTSGWIDDRAFYDARGDLDSVFQSVKSSIESIRPGKTWVYVNHWWVTQLPMFETCPHLIAPPTDTPYVGTDFLHMYFGLVAYQGDSWYPGPGTTVGTEYMTGKPFRETPFTEPEPDQGASTGIKTQVHDASVARVQAAVDRFAGFRVMLYGSDVPIKVWDNTGSGFTATTFSNVTDGHNAFLQAEATDLSSYGYTYEGMGTGISADTLKNKIAAHFGFNPSTGADL